MNKRLIYTLALWQLLILVFAYIGINYLKIQTGYLGSPDFLKTPLFWFHSNFDGVHYIEIAKWGYRPLMYFFFPLYPNLIRLVASVTSLSDYSIALSGQVVSLVSFVVSFKYLYKLLILDYKKSTIYLTFALILLFPTSYYFTAVYTEGLFFALCILSIYFARKKMWLLSGIFGGLASLARIVGVILFLSAAIEWFLLYRQKKVTLINFIPLLLIPIGFLSYVLYLKINTGDALAFFHNISIYGDQRSSHFVLLPQVYYRYIFKILPSSTSYWPTFVTTLLEFASGVLFLIVSVLAYFKLRLSYFAFLSIGFLIPTLTGSFSSLPRYVLVLFPGFLVLAIVIEKLPPAIKYLTLFISICLLGLFTSMFAAGYWVS